VTAPVGTTLMTLLVARFAHKKEWFSRFDKSLPLLTPGRVVLGIAVFLAAVSGLSFARYIDFPALYAGIPRPLTFYARENAVEFRNSRFYPLGGFIDSDYLWKATTPPRGVAHLATALNMVERRQVPADFFKMPPYWWDPKLNQSTRIYSTGGFPAANRGSDGLHVLLTYEETTGVLHAWIKDNF
jgi:hypothetical protein